MRRLQERRVVFSVSLPADLEGKLVELAEARGKSRSGIVAEIVAGALEARRPQPEPIVVKQSR